MNATDESLGAGNETPVDLAAVQADDALLDMLGGPVVITDDELSRVLYAWRREVDAEPIGELVDTDTGMAAIDAARKPARRRHYPTLSLIAAIGAALVLIFSVAGLLSLHSHPGDLLWPLHEVLYPMDGAR